MRLPDIAVPATPAARLADEVAGGYASAGHSVRSFYRGAAYKGLNDLSFRTELLYVRLSCTTSA